MTSTTLMKRYARLLTVKPVDRDVSIALDRARLNLLYQLEKMGVTAETLEAAVILALTRGGDA